jgi:hypothetical protein
MKSLKIANKKTAYLIQKEMLKHFKPNHLIKVVSKFSVGALASDEEYGFRNFSGFKFQFDDDIPTKIRNYILQKCHGECDDRKYARCEFGKHIKSKGEPSDDTAGHTFYECKLITYEFNDDVNDDESPIQSKEKHRAEIRPTFDKFWVN